MCVVIPRRSHHALALRVSYRNKVGVCIDTAISASLSRPLSIQPLPRKGHSLAAKTNRLVAISIGLCARVDTMTGGRYFGIDVPANSVNKASSDGNRF
ncbi:hypothetical protein PoB_002225400 [Plakobranchus ocellatus]|uniref:Uncharacterized protein n=1 Tax=Plakobranchus ocellatus TaxID=259542 RepID=A0AAV3ZMY8_9GAST|nr:hypothetical protein PoB_002225400 [Plakobranchus ocellatus]